MYSIHWSLSRVKIQKDHYGYCGLHVPSKAETCGMNLRRKADLAAIKAESQLPDALSLSIADLPEEHSGAATFLTLF